jgi:hypothetical protein
MICTILIFCEKNNTGEYTNVYYRNKDRVCLIISNIKLTLHRFDTDKIVK